ncbi:MAG TPA: ABC transporter ATP-binding protein [Candidatus Fusicatenibacter merdavium]|uniref:ABC transporter ATP-binding protein n=1 Tax=Candidatus Fusicatenibacter merdavium TaxID=2838600 RepID=A0A9D1XAM6_9FIRM|nr:ABC transporter ATP-binding protein [Candidatus Fusicatenibacter merdavium]
MTENIAIQVDHLSKMYKLYDKPTDRFKEAMGIKKKKYYKEHYALRDVSMDVKQGECVGIIGTNGSGKSTILKIITGTLSPTSGTVTVNGRISALLELGAGFNMEYTGIENIYLNGTMMGFSREEIDQRLEGILQFADIGDFVHQPVKTYSSGMFVRLAFAVAINIDPEILIVDEALSVGDVFFQAKCYHKFEEFKRMGKTILFVSHDLGSVAKYCDRVILLNQGVKTAEGNPKEIIDIYKQILVGKNGEVPEQQTAEEEKPKEIPDILKQDVEGSWKSHIKLNPDLLDYGEKYAEIIDFCLRDESGDITTSIVKNTYFQICMKVRFHRMIQDPIFAFTIKDLQGTEVTGTNTMYENISCGPVNEGEEKTVVFTQKMNLQGRSYLLSLGCVGFSDNRFTVYHRLYDCCDINVISDKNTVGFYDMDSIVQIQ